MFHGAITVELTPDEAKKILRGVAKGKPLLRIFKKQRKSLYLLY